MVTGSVERKNSPFSLTSALADLTTPVSRIQRIGSTAATRRAIAADWKTHRARSSSAPL